MSYTFEKIIVGDDLQTAFTTATTMARWSGPNDRRVHPDDLALSAKTEVIEVPRPGWVTSEKVVSWLRGEVPVPDKFAEELDGVMNFALDEDAPALAVPLSWKELEPILNERGLPMRPTPQAYRVIGTTRTSPKPLQRRKRRTRAAPRKARAAAPRKPRTKKGDSPETGEEQKVA